MNKIILNKEFMDYIELSLNNNVDNIIYIIIVGYNKFLNKVNNIELPNFIKSLFYFIVDKYKIVFDNKINIDNKIFHAIETFQLSILNYDDNLSLFDTYYIYK